MVAEIEKEVRYLINDEIKRNVSDNCELVRDTYYTMDIVVGLNGFDSLSTYGYIVRIRDKGNEIYVENKRRLSNGDFKEERIIVENIKTPLKFFMNMGYSPYLIIERFRRELKYKNLKIFIDDINLLGTFIEIEYENDDFEIIKEFVEKFNIIDEPQELYGDIFKKRIKEEKFKNDFDGFVKDLLTNIQ